MSPEAEELLAIATPERANWKRRSIVLALIVVLAGGGVFWARSRFQRPDALDVQTATVDRGPIVAKVTATGVLSALVTVQVGSQVSGRIKEIAVDFNAPVKKGQVIAKLDPQLFEAAVEQARANMIAAQGNLRRAKVQAVDAQKQAARSKSLAERKLIAQADADTSEANGESAVAQADAAEGAVAQAKASLHQAELNLSYTTISSPIDGIVISRNVDVGQTVAASLQAPILFVLAEDLQKMQVDTSVGEADVGRLQPGMAASFLVDAFPGQHFEGSVRQIRNAAQIVQSVVTYDAVIDVQNPGLLLKPGMTANVTLVVAEKDDVLRVPNAALRFRPTPEVLARANGGKAPPKRAARPPAEKTTAKVASASDKRTVWVLRDGRPESVSVRVGISDGSWTELVEGKLEAGDVLITDAGGAAPGQPPPSGGRGFRIL